MDRTLRAMFAWDGSNRQFFDKADFITLGENSMEFVTPELGVFPATVAKILTGHPAPEGCLLNPEALPRWRGLA